MMKTPIRVACFHSTSTGYIHTLSSSERTFLTVMNISNGKSKHFCKAFSSFDHRPNCLTTFKTRIQLSLHPVEIARLLYIFGLGQRAFLHWIYLFSSLAKLVKTFILFGDFIAFYNFSFFTACSFFPTCFDFLMPVQYAFVLTC